MKISAVLALLASTVQGAEVNSKDINIPIDSLMDQKLEMATTAPGSDDGDLTQMQDELFEIEQLIEKADQDFEGDNEEST